MKHYYCTYFDRNYLAKALALLISLQKHEKNDYLVFAICMDETSQQILARLNRPNVKIVPIHEIEEDDHELIAAKKDRTPIEYYWTAAPTIILRLLERHPEIDVLTYLDSDLFFYSSPDPIYQELGAQSILILEHRYTPRLKNLELENGKYDAGLLCFRNNSYGLKALRWWRERCNEWCYSRYENGKMGNIKYLDDWPERFEQVVNLQNKGSALAPWNHDQFAYREEKPGKVTVDGDRLIFYHFSALEFVSPMIVIPVIRLHFILNRPIIQFCYLPYIETLQNAIERIQKVSSDFDFGLINQNALGVEHTFLARVELQQAVQDLKLPHVPIKISSNWTCYTSPQMEDYSDISKVVTGTKLETTNFVTQQPDYEDNKLLFDLEKNPLARIIKILYVVGAHKFQERGLFTRIFPNLEHIYLFEPLPELFAYLKLFEQQDNRVKVFPFALSNENGRAEFHVTNFGSDSSSLLPFGKHKEIFPSVQVMKDIPVETRTLESVISSENLFPPDLLFMDVQGAEYIILSALPPELQATILLIYTEASKEEFYLGSKTLDDLTALLKPEFIFNGFHPLMPQTPTHGNALFTNQALYAKNMLELILESDDIQTFIDANLPYLTPQIAKLALDNAFIARKEDQVELAEGLEDLNNYILNLIDTRQKIQKKSEQNVKDDDQLAEKAVTHSSPDTYLVTAIVSTYKSASFIRECLEDLVNQTIANRLEIIVVDAASPENECEVVLEFQKKYPNITYIRTGERISVYAAWNVAVKNARGRYLTSFSTNDRLKKDAYEQLADALDHHPEVALVYGDSYITNTPHEIFENHTRTGAMIWPEYRYADILENCRVGPHPMWRNEIHQQIGLFDETFEAMGDQDFWIRVGEKYPLLHIPVFTGLYWNTKSALTGDVVRNTRELTLIRQKYREIKGGMTIAQWDQARTLINQAQIDVNQRKMTAGLKLINRAIDLAPDLSGVWVAKGRLLSLMGDHLNAANCFLKAIELAPDVFEIRFGLVDEFISTNNLSQAREILTNLKSIMPNLAGIYQKEELLAVAATKSSGMKVKKPEKIGEPITRKK